MEKKEGVSGRKTHTLSIDNKISTTTNSRLPPVNGKITSCPHGILVWSFIGLVKWKTSESAFAFSPILTVNVSDGDICENHITVAPL